MNTKMGSKADVDTKMEGEEISDYSLATYIRQNSENFQRLNSVTDSVCLPAEERRLIEMELFQESCSKCTCNSAEYCSSECKETHRQNQLLPTTTSVHTAARETRHHYPRTNSFTGTGTSKCSRASSKCSPQTVKTKKVKETKLDMSPLSSNDSVESDKPSTWWTVLKWTGVILLAVVVTAVLTALVCSFVLPYFNSGSQSVTNSEVTGEARQTVQPNTHYVADRLFEEFSDRHGKKEDYVSYSLDQDRFVKGGPYLRWVPNEISREFTLTANDCLRVSRRAHYQIYSKITFEFWPKNETNSVYHNVQLVRDGGREILDKDVVTIPPPFLRQRRMLKSSLILVLQEFHAGDVICVMVQDTSLVYASKIDSSLKVIRKL